MRVRLPVGGIAAGCLVAVLGVMPAKAQSLADTLVTAFINSPELRSEYANLRVAEELAVQARSQGRLDVRGTASIDWEYSNWDDYGFPTTLALQADQPLYTGGQVENSVAAASTRITAQKAVLTAIEQNVLLDAVTAYYNVLRDMAFVDLGINNVRVLSEQLRAASERFEVGEVTRTDVEQARARVAASRSSLASARGSLAASREAYQRVVGQAPGDLAPPPPLPDVPPAVSDAVAIALLNDPALIASRLQRDAAGYDVRAAIGALLPQISLRSALSRNDVLRDSFDATNSLSFGVTVSIPIYQGGFNYSNIREAQAIVEREVAGITSAERDAAQQVGIAFAQLEAAQASIEAGELEVEAAELAFEGVVEEARVGARTTLDVLDAEQEVLNARADLIEAQRDLAVASYTLLAAIGMLTVEHLGLDVGLEGQTLAAESAYETVRAREFGYDSTEDTVWTTRWRP